MITHRTYRIPLDDGLISDVSTWPRAEEVACAVARELAARDGIDHASVADHDHFSVVEGRDDNHIDVVIVGWLPPTPTITDEERAEGWEVTPTPSRLRAGVSYTFDPSTIPPDDVMDRFVDRFRRDGGWA